MRRIALCLTLISTLQAQTGEVAVETAQATETTWQNWTFVGTAIVTAAAGVLAIAFDDGQNAH